MKNKLFELLIEIVTFFNDPSQDKRILEKAGFSEQLTSLPIIVHVGREQPISIGELSKKLGRDHSSVSRQIDKLEAQQLVKTNDAKTDGRVREILLSEKGAAILAQIDQARTQLMNEALTDWDQISLEELERSLTHLVMTLNKINN